MKNKFIYLFYDFASIIMTSVIAVAAIFTFGFKISTVNGSSMNNTLKHGDRLVITAKDNSVDYGDIVIISQPNDYNEVLVKRVIGLGGQTIDIDTDKGTVSIDGKVLDEPYVREKMVVAGDGFDYPLTIPEGKVFVMGDNRNYSGDSRFAAVGLIDERYIVGEAFYRIGDTALLNRDFSSPASEK